MVNSVSKINYNPAFKKVYTDNIRPQDKKTEFKNYRDSFFRNAKESTPMLLGLTSVLTVLDFGKNSSVKISKLLKKNLVRYFAPVLIATSMLCAVIENKKSKNV